MIAQAIETLSIDRRNTGRALSTTLVLKGVLVDLEAEFGEFTRRIKEDEHEGDRFSGLDIEVRER